MKEALERMALGWRNLPQTTKLLLAALLLVSAVALWYAGLYLPAQVAAEPPPLAVEGLPRGIEAPPIPPLGGAPEAAPAEPPREAASPPAPAPAPAALPVPRPAREAPPNPFVPLVVEVAPPAPPAPVPAPAPQPVPPGPPVRVTPGTPLPAPAQRPLPGTLGALPAPKVLSPGLQAEVPPGRVEPPVNLLPPAFLVETPLPAETGVGAAAAAPPSRSPLELLVEERGLRLSGTLLGPVSVAILEGKEGYLVLPAGSPIPGSEAVIRRVEGDRVILAMGEETLEITMEASEAGGGE